MSLGQDHGDFASLTDRDGNPLQLQDTGKRGLTRAERVAVNILYNDGWSVGELKLTFQVGENSIHHTLNSETGQALHSQAVKIGREL